MNPAISLAIAVFLMVIAARLWPPLIYILTGIVILLLLVKLIRRAARLIGRSSIRKISDTNLTIGIFSGFLLAVAAAADYTLQPKISAVVLLLCFAGAIAVVGIVIGAVEFLARRYR